jgi:hypothetical protein
MHSVMQRTLPPHLQQEPCPRLPWRGAVLRIGPRVVERLVKGLAKEPDLEKGHGDRDDEEE